MAQIPLIAIGRIPAVKKRKVLGNIVFWIGLFAGESSASMHSTCQPTHPQQVSLFSASRIAHTKGPEFDIMGGMIV